MRWSRRFRPPPHRPSLNCLLSLPSSEPVPPAPSGLPGPWPAACRPPSPAPPPLTGPGPVAGAQGPRQAEGAEFFRPGNPGFVGSESAGPLAGARRSGSPWGSRARTEASTAPSRPAESPGSREDARAPSREAPIPAPAPGGARSNPSRRPADFRTCAELPCARRAAPPPPASRRAPRRKGRSRQ